MEQNKKIECNRHFGFTLIELLVSISILATISIVGYVSYAAHMKNSYNATRIETIDSLHLSLSDYSQLKKTLPDPNSNYVAYDERGTYMHSLSGAYGVSGHASNDFLPAGYVNFQATDPESNQFYGYGKLTDNSSFDLAATLYDDVTGGYKTYLRGTYPKQRLASLVRAYSSSNFVSQDSTEDLPYNPYERKVTASVSSSSGTVTLKNSTGNALSLTGELNSGDIVTVATGSTALLHISDGSELSLGSTTSQTELALSSLSYSDDNNLASKVALYLKSGEVWTEAPHLRTEADSASDFSIRTDTAVAAVRGTVFGMEVSSTGVTDIALVFGKLEVTRITANASGDILSQQSFVASDGFSTTATGWFIIDGSGSYMVVPDGGQAITLEGIANTAPDGTVSPTSTGTLSPTDVQNKIQHPPFSLGYRPLADRISFSVDAHGANMITGILSVTFQNPGADSYELYFGTGVIDPTQTFPVPPETPSYTGTLNTATGTTTLTGAFPYNADTNISRVYSLKICYQGQCSAPDIKNLWGDIFSFEGFRVWGEDNKQNPGLLTWDTTSPVAGADNVTTPFNTQKKGIDVLANDSDDSKVSPTLTGTLSQQIGWTFGVNVGKIDFSPTMGFSGSASTVYTIQDGSNNTSTGALTVTVEASTCTTIKDICEPGLVAYAPYSNGTSISNTLGMFRANGDSLFVSQATLEDATVKYVPILDTAHMSFYPASDAMDYGAVGSPSNYQGSETSSIRIARLNLLSDNGFSPEWSRGLWGVNGSNTGVYLDNYWNDSYLKYDLSPLGLSGSFSIEMSVRGGALKRIDSYYNLFWFSSKSDWTNVNYTNFWASINTSGFLWMYNTCRDEGSCFPSSPISSINLGTAVIDSSQFYTVRADIWGTNTHISITWNGLNLSGVVSNPVLISSPYLFIGSKPSKQNQWNDIIDYVKIYKY